MKVVLTKISDDVFEGFHPNGIDEGYMIVGEPEKTPTVGERFSVFNELRYLTTSMVTEILSETEDKITFKTLNSTYVLDYVNKD